MKTFTETITVQYGPDNKESAGVKLSGFLLEPVCVDKNRLRPAVIICPGGGYGHLSAREGEPVAMRYLAMGCHAFVLYYSVAPVTFPAALLELAESVAFIRSHAEEWRLDSERIYVSGFSAGGHLAGSLGVFWKRPFVWEPLGLTPEQIRPNGMILCYPVIHSGEYAHRESFRKLLGERAEEEELLRLNSLELQVTEDTPRTFLWHTAADGSVPVENSLLFAQALSRHGISFELHVYPEGKHGLSLANAEVASSENGIVEACQDWIRAVELWIG